MPKVSIILPVYNGAEFLSKSIDSIINQTFKDWELIIVNDCSTDLTPQIIDEYIKKDSRIKVINNERNLKLSESLNVGFSNATGKYYTWTSDDNEYYPEAIEKMLHFLEHNEDFGMVYARENVEKDGQIEPYIWCDAPTTPDTLLRLCVPGACFLYREEVARIVGKYEKKAFLNEDHDYWLRILLVTNIWNLKEVLYMYRLTANSLTATRQAEIKQGKILLLRKYRKIYSEKFPEIKNIYKNELLFDNYILGNATWAECKENIPRRILYRFLADEYKFVCKNKMYINNILALGIKYVFKGLNLFLRYRREK